jgi:phospholipid/cholesterol/gamma-HCH transport system permease protein
VVPRVLAATIMLPTLVIIANTVMITSAFFVAATATDVTFEQFSAGLQLSYAHFQVAYSLIKAVMFGTAIGFLCSYEGYVAEVGAEGVGRSTAKAVVITSVAILVLDAITAGILAPLLQT